jgi:hypothetical protein
LFRIALHPLLHIVDDHGFKDKDIKTAKGIFKEQEEKPDHVDYEFQVYKGKFLLAMKGHVLLIPMMHRDSSWFRCATKYDGS